MNRKTLSVALAALVLFVAGCSHRHVPIVVSLAGAPALLPLGGAATLTATTNDKAGVNWTCQPVGLCGTFSSDQSTSGTTVTYTAPTDPTSVGLITIAAVSITSPGDSATAAIGVTTALGMGGTYVFYVQGNTQSGITPAGDDGLVYSLAGSVYIDPNSGLVIPNPALLAAGGPPGEQDFNDGLSLISAQPTGDAIIGGSLVVDPTTGLGTLTIATDSATAIPGETFAVQFVNGSHAMIVQFDGQATSSGSLDQQTATALPGGNFSFVTSGVDTTSAPVVNGGVFTFVAATDTVPTGSISGTNTVDTNDGGVFTPAQTLTATTTPEDQFGRGTITVTAPAPAGFETNLVYYVIGPEAIRIIGVDNGTNMGTSISATAVGSAFGQGATPSFTSASLTTSTNSVLSVSGTSMFVGTVLLGQITPTTTAATTGTFVGVADVDEAVPGTPASAITGSYSVPANGYGALSIASGAMDFTTLGIYFIDPAINPNDPNNTSGGGGALVADMDTNVIGVGVLVPQTDNTSADFTGNYAFGAQVISSNEADFIGSGVVDATLDLTGTGFLNDPGAFFAPAAQDSNVAFAGTFVPDATNLGRYTMSPLDVTVVTPAVPLATVVAYQASAGQLFWMENDTTSTFSGQLQQQVLPIVTPLPGFNGDSKKTHKR